jgi:lysozyme family protein
MADIDTLISALITREGGYVNDSHDAGGATNFGITEAVARANGFAGNMRDLPREEAAAIYKRIYWLRPGFDAIAAVYPKVAAELFDTGVNMGPSVAATFLQRLLNALGMEAGESDGRIGPASLAALARFHGVRGPAGEAALVRALDALQGERYVRICENNPSQSKFLFGWIDKRLGQAL